MIQHARKSIVCAAVVAALGVTSAAFSTTASAALVIDGNYALEIVPTAIGTGAYGTFFKITPPTGLESSFTFGGLPSNAASQGMTNNSTLVTVTNDFSALYGADGVPGIYGTSTAADGVAGRIVFDVVNGNIGNATAFSVDNVAGTAGGNFSQYIAGGDLSGFGGSIDNNGVMNFSMPGRFGAIDGPTGGVVGPWNFDSNTTLLNGFTTGSVTGTPGTINGVACTGSAGSYSCTLVSGGAVGPAWGTFNGNPYYEVWKINLTRLGDATTVIPIPAAVWLFGSGLLGLVGVARRKKQT
jgi:hypothetical protein